MLYVPRRAGSQICLQLGLTQAALASPMPGTTQNPHPVTRDSTSARLPKMEKPAPRVRLGHEFGRIHGPDIGAVCDPAGARLRGSHGLLARLRAGLRLRRQPAAAVFTGAPAADAAGVAFVVRAQLPAYIGRIGAGARDRIVSAGLTAAHRRRYFD